MNDEIVVEEGISRFGLRRIHVMRAGQKVDRERVYEHVGYGEIEAVLEYQDEELGMWHLRVYWRDLTPDPSPERGGAQEIIGQEVVDG